MAAIQSWYPDYLVVWGLSVLFQATLVAAVALVVARCVGRAAMPRHWTLFSALVLLLLIPVVATVATLCGRSFFSLSFAQASPGANPTIDESQATESPGAGLPDHSSVERPPIDSRAGDVPESAPHLPKSASDATVAGAILHEPRMQAGSLPLPSLVWISTAVLFAVWCIGAGVLLLRLIRAWWQLARIIRTAEPVAMAWLDDVVEEACRDSGISQAPRILCSPRVQSSGVGGIWRPCVLLPMGICEQVGRAQLRDILVHEFAHVIRRDSVVVLLQNLAAVLYWPHPLVRRINRLLACTREEICDNHVLATTDAPSYSRTLLEFAELVPDNHAMPATVALLGSQWKLESRIAAILDERRNRMTRLSKLQFVSMLIQFAVLAVLTVGGTITLADDGDPDVQKWLAALGTKEEVRFQALNKLVQLGDRSIEATRKVLNDTSQPFPRRWQAAMVLGALKAKVAIPDLLKIVEGDDHLVVTGVAAEQLGRIGDPSVVPRLKKALDKQADPLVKHLIEKSVAVLEGHQPPRVALRAANLDFEAGTWAGDYPTRWGGGGKGYRLSVETEDVHQGNGSGRIERVGEGGRCGTLTQAISAWEFVGKRIKYSGFLRTKEAERAGLWMRIDAVDDGVVQTLEFDNMQNRPVKGTSDWAEHAIVLDVPKEAKTVTFGFLIGGDGIVWGDDLKIEIVGKRGEGPETTGRSKQFIQQASATARVKELLTDLNLDFEAGTQARGLPKGWGRGSKGYRVSVDTENVHQGGGSGRIERIGAGGRFGTVVQSIPAKEFVGKRIKYSGFLRTKEAERAGMWMRIEAVDIRRVLDADNMHDRWVKGTTDWAEHAVILDVPQKADRIVFGFLIGGDGIVWGDDLKIEIVGKLGEGPETTGLSKQRSKPASNLDFEGGTRDGDYPKRWSPGGQTYRLSVDTKTVHQGGASGRMENLGEGRSGTMMQTIGAKEYLGKRIKYSGFLRTGGVDRASLWMRIDAVVDGIRKPLKFDNMHDRALKGTSNWTELMIVLDVPQEAQNITLGVMVSGCGIVWADDLKIEVVGNLGEGPEPTGIDMSQDPAPAK